jgi:sugar lactone lactonase YvrE
VDGGVGFASGRAIAADAASNVYLADWSTSEPGCTRIRKVDYEGNTTTIAGTGAQGYVNGPGASAQFYEPTGIAVDRLRNIYVADSLNNRIRMITPEGMVSTVAGNGTAAFDDGDGPPDTPSSATFNLPTGIAVDLAGNIFVADTKNNSIRMISPDGGTTTVAGNGTAGLVNGTLGKGGTTEFNYPISIAVDSKDNLYVADHGNCAIRMITLPGAP